MSNNTPEITTEAVKYTIGNSSVTATRRDTPQSDGSVREEWVFTIHQVQSANGVSPTQGYVERVATSVKERDRVGADLANLVDRYQKSLLSVQETFAKDVQKFFGVPTTPGGNS